MQSPEHVKISDFGLTKILDVGETTFKSARGKVPVRWLAPESLRHRLYTHKSDVWSYGTFTIIATQQCNLPAFGTFFKSINVTV